MLAACADAWALPPMENPAVPIAEERPDARHLCPRCGGGFHCGMHDASPCACSRLTLQASHLAALRSVYAGCLCMRCLAAVAAGQDVGPVPPTPA